MNKGLRWSVSISTLAASLALAVPGTAAAVPHPELKALAPVFGGRLYAVSTPDSHNVFAAGLVEYWNGSRLTLPASPNPPSGYLNVLWGVRAVSRTSVWAVGTTDYESTLIMQWNGTAWS